MIKLYSLILILSIGAFGMTPKEECEKIMNQLIPMVEQLLKKNGEFYPIGAVMKSNDSIEHVAFFDGDDHPQSNAVIEGLTKTFKALAEKNEICAAGIAYDAKVTTPARKKSDGVVVSLQHKDGYCVAVVLPYRFGLFHKIIWDPMFATEGENKIFRRS